MSVHGVRTYQPRDRDAVSALLARLPHAHPRAEERLQAKLDQVERGEAHCFVSPGLGGLCGAAIFTPKPDGRIKLSIVFVAPQFRGRGIGGELLGYAAPLWQGRQAFALVPPATARELAGVLSRHGFERAGVEHGPGGDEILFVAAG